jgi:cytochrome c oxidase subunit IV
MDADEKREGPGTGTFVAVWAVLIALTGLLAFVSSLGHGAAVVALLTISPIKAGLVVYYFMHLKYEGLLLKGVLLVALGTLLVFFALLFADLSFR